MPYLKPERPEKVSAPSLLSSKKRGERLVCLTAYDYPTARILDEAGKPTTTEPLVTKFPDDFPELKKDKRELFPITSPILLNRAGGFTIMIDAVDETTKKSAKLSIPFKVVDPAGKSTRAH